MPRDENNDLNQNIMGAMDDGLDSEMDYMSSQGSKRNFAERVKIPKGHTWLLRFLPAQMGAKKYWHARIARHWINGKPVTCIRNTSPHFGGDPEARCLICDLVAKNVNNRDRDLADIARKADQVPQWLTYCLVFQKDDGRRIEAIKGDAKWKVWEFWHYQSSFDTLRTLFQRFKTEQRPLSIMDWKEGNDIYVSAKKRGLALDRDDRQPIVTGEPEKVEAIIAKITAQLRDPDFEFPKRNKIQEMANKFDEMLSDGGGGGGRRDRFDEDEGDDEGGSRGSRGRGRDDDDGDRGGSRSRRDDDDGDRGGRSRPKDDDDGDRGGGGERSRSARDEDEGGGSRRSAKDDDDLDYSPSPRASERSRDEKPRDEKPRDEKPKDNRRSDPRDEERRRDPPVDRDPPRDPDGRDDERGDRRPRDDDRGGRSRDDGDRPREESRGPAPTSRRLEALPSASRVTPPPASTPAAAAQSSIDEEEETVPEEKRDPAPPSSAHLPPGDDDGEEAPPAVTAPAGSGSKLTDRIKRGCDRMNDRP